MSLAKYQPWLLFPIYMVMYADVAYLENSLSFYEYTLVLIDR